MRRKITPFLGLLLVLIVVSSTMDAQNRRSRSASTNMNGDQPVTSCGDLRITYDRRPAITEEVEMTLSAAQVPVLRTQMGNGGIFITGWDRSEYSVKTCKAVPGDDPNATSTLREITTTSSGDGQFT